MDLYVYVTRRWLGKAGGQLDSPDRRGAARGSAARRSDGRGSSYRCLASAWEIKSGSAASTREQEDREPCREGARSRHSADGFRISDEHLFSLSLSEQPGLLNPLALLSPQAAPAAPAPADQQDGAALLAMLQVPAAAAAAPTAVEAKRPEAPASSASAATPAKASKPPKGVTLARGEAVYEVGAVAASARKQTKVTAITIYNTDPGYRAGRLIAVSSRYICYGVRGGSIRVIHQTTGQRLLQKGHTTAELADISISGDDDACTLAAVAGNINTHTHTHTHTHTQRERERERERERAEAGRTREGENPEPRR